MSTVEPMEYETLIRKAFRCKRNEVAGADAELWSRYKGTAADLEKKRQGQHSDSNNSLEELYPHERVLAGKISAHLHMALDWVREKYKEHLREDQEQLLSEQIGNLLEDNPSKDQLEKVIVKGQEVTKELSLEVGG